MLSAGDLTSRSSPSPKISIPELFYQKPIIMKVLHYNYLTSVKEERLVDALASEISCICCIYSNKKEAQFLAHTTVH